MAKSRSRITPAGRVRAAGFAAKPPNFAKQKKRRCGAAGKGLKYEEQAKKYLERKLGDEFVPGPWMVFKNDFGERWCQPDGLWIDPVRGRITIIEIKYAHSVAAWHQLWQLYMPVVKAAFDRAPWEYRAVEIVRWYDSTLNFPGPANLRPSLIKAEPDETAVHIWNPKRNR